MAWLHARPKKHDKDTEPTSRIDGFSEDDHRRRMPEVIGGEYLITHWSECGLFGSGMGGAEPLSWCEIQAYSIQCGADLDCWESKQIRKMSQAYTSYKVKADKMNCPAPFRVEMTDEDKARQAKEIRASFSKLKNM